MCGPIWLGFGCFNLQKQTTCARGSRFVGLTQNWQSCRHLSLHKHIALQCLLCNCTWKEQHIAIMKQKVMNAIDLYWVWKSVLQLCLQSLRTSHLTFHAIQYIKTKNYGLRIAILLKQYLSDKILATERYGLHRFWNAYHQASFNEWADIIRWNIHLIHALKHIMLQSLKLV